MQSQESSGDQVFHLLIEEAAGIIAKRVVEQLQPQLLRLLRTDDRGPSASGSHKKQTNDKDHKSLWSVDAIAKDSDTSPATWRRWILERKIPVVRLGRTVRIKDSDYRKMIENSVTPELQWDRGSNRFT